MTQARPLVVCAHDDTFLDDVLQLVTMIGAEAEVANDLVAARASWSRAVLVLVDSRQAAALPRARLPRRAGVVIVCRSEPDSDIWQLAVQLGAEHVCVLPRDAGWLSGRIADGVEDLGVTGNVVGVVGGRGGAGATVLAAALAVTAARSGADTMLVDVDAAGGGIDLVLGGEDTGGLRWPGLSGATGRLSYDALTGALPRPHGVALLTFDRSEVDDLDPATVQAVIQAGRRSGGVVVVDLPRRLDSAAVEACALVDRTLLVVPAEVRAAAAARRIAAMVGEHSRSVAAIVRTPAPAGVLPEAVAETVGVPLAGVLPREPGLSAALERGDAPAVRGRGPLAMLCAELLDDLRGARSRRSPR